MKIRRGLLCLAVWILAAALIFSTGAVYADENRTIKADAAEESEGSDEGEGGNTVPVWSSEQSGDAESPEAPDLGSSEHTSTDAEPSFSEPVTDASEKTTGSTPPITQAPPVTAPPQTDPPVTDAPTVTTVPTTVQPTVTEPETTAVDTRSTEVLILTGVPQISGYHSLSTDDSAALPDDDAQLIPQPWESDSEVLTDTQASSDRDPFTSTQDGSALPVTLAGEANGQTQSGGGHVFMLALIFGGACAAGAALLIVLKAKNIQ